MIKSLLKIAPLVASLGILSCSTVQTVQPPMTLQAEIAAIGALNIAQISTNDKAYVHKFATALLSLTQAQIDAPTIVALVPALPAQISPYVPLLINVAVAELDNELRISGTHNPTVFAYAQAVANGLLNAGF